VPGNVRKLWVFIFSLVACTGAGSTPSSFDSIRADTSWVTSEVTKSLTSAGQFPLGRPPAGGVAQVTEAQARRLGTAWIRNFFPWVQGNLEADRGAKIDREKLTVCPRVYYAESPFELVDDVEDAGVARRVHGPWWAVQLCVDRVPQVLLGIAGYATNLWIEGGHIRMPRQSGTEFVWRGIPSTLPEWPISPERAAHLAAAATGLRVSGVPRLVLPYFRDGAVFIARWEVPLEHAVHMTSATNSAGIDEPRLFVGPQVAGDFQSALLTAASDQPDTISIEIHKIIGIPRFPVQRDVRLAKLARRPGGVVRFEHAEILK